MNYFQTPLFDLMQAVQRSDAQGVHDALKNGAPLNGDDDGEHVPLLWSANNDSIDMMQLLLSLGADVNVENNYEENAFDKCCDGLIFQTNISVCSHMMLLLKNHGITVNDEKCSYTLARYAHAPEIQNFLDLDMMNHSDYKQGFGVLTAFAMSKVSDASKPYHNLVCHALQHEPLSQINYTGLTPWEMAKATSRTDAVQLLEQYSNGSFLGVELLAQRLFSRYDDITHLPDQNIEDVPIDQLYVLEATIKDRLHHDHVVEQAKEMFSEILQEVRRYIELHELHHAVSTHTNTSKISKKM